LGLGIESGSKFVRDGVQKGRFGDLDIAAVVRKTREAGIYVGANYIFGLPDDTYESMQETFDMAVQLNTEWANFYSAMAYPGSQLYKLALEHNWPLPEDWLGYSQHAREALPLPTETLSGPEVMAFRDLAFTKYFTNPRYLNMVEQKFGNKVVEHMKHMTNHNLDRNFKPTKPIVDPVVRNLV
jgi:anaerobic magnesium-protoporphyrin IX monomethyl ester cyclase